jgi:hypothetical protein
VPKPKDNDTFLADLTKAMCDGIAEGSANGGEVYESAKESRLGRVKPLYGRSFDPPPLNADGSLVSPDADTPKLLKGGKKSAKKADKKAVKKPKKK